MARILKDKRHKTFLLENVRNLISHNKGQTFEIIINTLERLDYHVEYKLLKARDFNVPQNQKEYILLVLTRNR
nr:DNA cytosine methyltransferase [[Mycoplasma] imitans]